MEKETKIVYVMHRFGGDVDTLRKTREWCAFLSAHFDALFCAPWVAFCEFWPNTGVTLRRGMALDFAAIRQFDSGIAVGGLFSPGMMDERAYAEPLGKVIVDATAYETPNQLLADSEGMRRLEEIYGRAPR